MSKHLDISWVSLWRVLFMLIFAVALYFLRDVLVILFLALIISSALDAPITYLGKKRIPRIIGALLIFLAIIVILASILYVIIPVVLVEFKGLFTSFETSFLSNLQTSFGITKQTIANIEANIGAIVDDLFSGTIPFVGLITNIFGGIIFLLSVLILSFYLSVNRDGVEKFLKAVLPSMWEEYIIDIYSRVRKKMGLWLQGQVVLSLAVGTTTFLGLLILGVDYSLFLGIMAGILEIVPIVGPVFIGVIAFLVAVSNSWTLGVSVIVLFVIIQQMESHLLVPIVMRKTIGLHPVVVVLSLLAGSQLAGFVGLILAVPTAVIIEEIIEDWAARKRSYA